MKAYSIKHLEKMKLKELKAHDNEAYYYWHNVRTILMHKQLTEGKR